MNTHRKRLHTFRNERAISRTMALLMAVAILGVHTAVAAEALTTCGNGTYLTSKLRPVSFQIPAPLDPQYIVGAGLDSNDGLILWFQDGNLVIGPLQKFFNPHVMGGPYKLKKHTPTQIVAMAIGDNDTVYTWFNDNTYSMGDVADLEKYSSGNAYYLPAGKRVEQIVDVSMTSHAQKTTVTYFADGDVYHGEPGNLGAFGNKGQVSLSDNLTPWTMLGVAQGRSTDVHAWHLKPYAQQPPNGGWNPPPNGGWQQPSGGWNQNPNGGWNQNPNGNWNQNPNGGWNPPSGNWQQPPPKSSGKGFWFGPNGFGFSDGKGNSINLNL